MKISGVEWVSEFVFGKFDLDDNGGLDMYEFVSFSKEEDVMLRFYMMNKDLNDFITLEEFLAYFAKCKCIPGTC